jgi:hypothetical protein
MKVATVAGKAGEAKHRRVFHPIGWVTTGVKRQPVAGCEIDILPGLAGRHDHLSPRINRSLERQESWHGQVASASFDRRVRKHEVGETQQV